MDEYMSFDATFDAPKTFNGEPIPGLDEIFGLDDFYENQESSFSSATPSQPKEQLVPNSNTQLTLSNPEDFPSLRNFYSGTPRPKHAYTQRFPTGAGIHEKDAGSISFGGDAFAGME